MRPDVSAEAMAEAAERAARRDGQHMRYRLASPEAARILEALHDLYCAA